MYLMLCNQKICDVIDAIGNKGVLLLGRFTDERKAILDALAEELRTRDYLPILFDFDKPDSRATVATITLLARMARGSHAKPAPARRGCDAETATLPECRVRQPCSLSASCRSMSNSVRARPLSALQSA